MRTNILISSLIFTLFLSCDKTPTKSEGIAPQEHIAWPSLADSPWPMFHHDPQGTGRSEYTGPQLGEVAYTFNDSFWCEAGIAIGSDNILYFTSSGSACRLYAADASGEILWRVLLAEGHYVECLSTPVISSQNVIYVTSPGKVHAISADGSEYWTYQLSELGVSGVTLDKEGNLYLIVGKDMKLVSLASEGSLRWELTVPGGFSGFMPATFSPDGNVLYNGGLDSLYAISTDGKVLWSYWTGRWVSSTLVDNDGNIYFYSHGDSSITSLSPSGNVKWRTYASTLELDHISPIAPAMDRAGNVYFSGAKSGVQRRIVSLDNNGNVRWQLPLSSSSIGGGMTNELICDAASNLYFSSGANVYCVSSEGTILWKAPSPVITQTISIGIGSNRLCYVTLQNSPTLQIVGVK